MPLWVQQLLVIVIVGGAFAFVAWHAVRSLSGKSSRVGSCCARGCGQTVEPMQQRESSDRERIVFIPSESLIKRR